jgi:hypothetical protein
VDRQIVKGLSNRVTRSAEGRIVRITFQYKKIKALTRFENRSISPAMEVGPVITTWQLGHMRDHVGMNRSVGVS